MTPAIQWTIPPSVLHWLETVPKGVPVALLLRHSVRGDLPADSPGDDVPLTEDGVRIARELGATLGPRLRTLRASPVLRCGQTAEAIREGARSELPIESDRMLGAPGAFVIEGRVAWQTWRTLGHERMVTHLAIGDHALPGMAHPDWAARFLVQHLMAACAEEPGVHVFVTHDALVGPTAERLLGVPLGPKPWPWFLEGAFFWREGGAVHAAYREHRRASRPGPLCGLEPSDVVEFARREIAATVGLDFPGRFFLAGGAFRTLLTGNPPRDLDFWAPSESDRSRLIEVLRDRGAEQRTKGEFADTFAYRGRIIDVPIKVEPSTLEGRLGRFDLALSAVGVEHLGGDRWLSVIHPLARESVERREVLFLKPLVNWRRALDTLERARAYAADLGYRVPAEEEAEVWRVFGAQEREMRQGMIDRLRRKRDTGGAVLDEARRRLHDSVRPR